MKFLTKLLAGLALACLSFAAFADTYRGDLKIGDGYCYAFKSHWQLCYDSATTNTVVKFDGVSKIEFKPDGTITAGGVDLGGGGGTVADAGGDTTTSVLLHGSPTGDLTPLTDAGLTYNATTNVLTSSGGLAGTATGNLPLTLAADTTVGFGANSLIVCNGACDGVPASGVQSRMQVKSSTTTGFLYDAIGATSFGQISMTENGGYLLGSNVAGTSWAQVYAHPPALFSGAYMVDLYTVADTPTGIDYSEFWSSTNNDENAFHMDADSFYMNAAKLRLSNFLSTRDDANTPVNLLNTDSSGDLKSEPLNSAALKTAMGLTIGANVQAYDADLTTYAGTTPGTGVMTALGINVGSAGAILVKGTSVCADLSNGATGCSTATGTSGATIPLLNGANTWSGVQTHTIDDSGTNSVVTVAEIGHTTTGTAASGLGASLDFALENASGTKIVSNQIQSVWNGTVTAGAEDPDLVFMGRRDGGALTEYARMHARNGNYSAGDFCVNDVSGIGQGICIAVGNSGVTKFMNYAGSAAEGVAASYFQDASADPADSGAIRVGNNVDALCAEKASAGTDSCLKVDSSDQWAFSNAGTNEFNIRATSVTIPAGNYLGTTSGGTDGRVYVNATSNLGLVDIRAGTVVRETHGDKKTGLTSGGATTIASLNVAADASAAVIVRYRLKVTDTTNHHNCTVAGLLTAVSENSGGTIKSAVDNSAGLDSTSICDSTNTASVSFAITNANPAVLSVTPTVTGFTATAITIDYNFDDLSDASSTQ